MYPFTKQLIEYYYNDDNKKLGFLILDVKGNYYKKVLEFAYNCNRLDDVIVIQLNGNYKYNPLNKDNIKSTILANRLKEILYLFSPNNSEDYWLDKASQIIENSITFIRLYNNNYVNFIELHKIITDYTYFTLQVKNIRNKFINSNFSKSDSYNLLNSINFLEKEYYKLDERTLSILKSEITRITNCFVADYDVQNTFCPTIENENFKGFSDVINKGKIVVLNMNIAEYKNLSKIIAAYLKLDFQSEVMSSISKTHRSVCFISDEYQEYVTTSDADFYAQSREAKCINIVATQSYTSLLNSLNNQNATKVIIQNLINKLWYRTDDIFTIEEIQKQIGKEDKKRTSTTISENSKENNYNYLTKRFISNNSNISESINSYYQQDFKYDYNEFTQDLKTFETIAFLSDGTKIIKPQKLYMIPYFKN